MESFEEVYQKYLKEVYCFLLRLSGDREMAEELTQQTFAIAFEKLENFRGECKLSVWLCQIAKHEYYAWTKKQKKICKIKLDGKSCRSRGGFIKWHNQSGKWTDHPKDST